MQRIPSLILPESLPTEAAIRSCNDNPSLAYTPELWEFEYEISRYLERVDARELSQRYRDILKNLRCLSTTDRHVIPRQSFLSSWYWFQKEHQTRYEFFLRDMEPPKSPLGETTCMPPGEAPKRPRCPNSGDVLFRYCKPQYADDFVNMGKFRISAASQYEKLEGDRARCDDELKKDSYIQGSRTTITHYTGQQMPIIGDVKRTVACPQYFTLCTACDWDIDLQNEFGGACAIITNVEEFSSRINEAVSKILPGWLFGHMPVEYYDPYTVSFKQKIYAEIQKDFRFAYQREFRFLWMNTGETEDSRDYIELELGRLDSIAELVETGHTAGHTT